MSGAQSVTTGSDTEAEQFNASRRTSNSSGSDDCPIEKVQ